MLLVLVMSGLLLTVQAPSAGSKANSKADNQFMAQLSEMNAAEVKLSRMAETKAQNQRVKDYARMMVTQHTQALERMHQPGMTTSGTIQDRTRDTGTTREKPREDVVDSIQLNREHQQVMERLKKATGAEFDRQYMEAMVKDHREAVRMLEREAGQQGNRQSNTQRNTTSGTSGRTGTAMHDHNQIAQDMLPIIRQHLQEAEAIQRELRDGGRQR